MAPRASFLSQPPITFGSFTGILEVHGNSWLITALVPPFFGSWYWFCDLSLSSWSSVASLSFFFQHNYFSRSMTNDQVLSLSMTVLELSFTVMFALDFTISDSQYWACTGASASFPPCVVCNQYIQLEKQNKQKRSTVLPLKYTWNSTRPKPMPDSSRWQEAKGSKTKSFGRYMIFKCYGKRDHKRANSTDSSQSPYVMSKCGCHCY